MSIIIHEMEVTLESPAQSPEEKREPVEQQSPSLVPHDIRTIIRHQSERTVRARAH